MKGTFKCLFWILIVCLWISGAHAAEPAAKNPQAKSPQAAAPQEAPSIQISEMTFNFGEVMETTEITHQFTVKNTGKGVLQIDQVRPG